MWRYLVFLIFASFAWSDIQVIDSSNTAWGYIEKYGVPRAEEIRKAEENLASSRIVGGLPAAVGQYPFQAGLIGSIIGMEGRSVSGGSLLSSTRVLTAAHCWNDGRIQVWRFTVVLGSTTLFSGGTRLESSVVHMHPDWTAALARHDIAVIYLPSAVTLSGGGIDTVNQSLSHVSLSVISNGVCSIAFPLIIQPSHICTSGVGGTSTCSGDSGGPLLATRNNKLVQIGIASFVHALGCESNLPAVFARVTEYLDFIKSHQ